MNILSIDASTKSTGIAVFNIQKKSLEYYQCITASSTDLIKRIYKMVDRINDIIKQHDITKIVLEQVRPEKGPSIKTQKALMYLQAAIQFMIHDNYPKLKIEYVYPSSWRAQCGIKNGRSIKRQELKLADIQHVRQKFKIEVNDDIADAICIGQASLIDSNFFKLPS